MNPYKYIVVFTLVAFFSCKNQRKIPEEKANFDSNKSYVNNKDSLVDRMLHGDTISYMRYMEDCYDYSFQDGLYWSVYFSDTYDYPLAHYHVFIAFYKPLYNGEGGFAILNETTKRYALKHLKKAIAKDSLFYEDYLDMDADSKKLFDMN